MKIESRFDKTMAGVPDRHGTAYSAEAIELVARQFCQQVKGELREDEHDWIVTWDGEVDWGKGPKMGKLTQVLS